MKRKYITPVTICIGKSITTLMAGSVNTTDYNGNDYNTTIDSEIQNGENNTDGSGNGPTFAKPTPLWDDDDDDML